MKKTTIDTQKIIETGLTITINNPFSEYLACTEFLSTSTAKKYKRSPLHKLLMEDKDTDAKSIGRMYHSYILEPLTFEQEYFIIDDRKKVDELINDHNYKAPRSTNLYKEWYAEQLDKNAGKIPISNEELSMFQDMKKELYRNPFIKYLIEKSEKEISAYGIVDGVLCKGRYDMLMLSKRWISDLKTVLDASDKGFQRYLTQFDGHLQPALYTQLAEQYLNDGMPWTFFWIAQEKFKPYAAAIYKASPQIINVGAHEMGLLIAQHKYCEETGDYRGYEVFVDNKFGIREISLPAYAIKDYQFFNNNEQ